MAALSLHNPLPRSLSPMYTCSQASSPAGGPTRLPGRQQGTLCFYHRKWGMAARYCRNPCSWQHQRPGNAPAAGGLGHLSSGGNLIHLLDSTSGSSCSVFPYQSSAPPSGPQLITTSGPPVPAWGVRKFTLSFFSHKFTFPFILGQGSYPILGNDFLAAHHLIVDPAHRHVLHEPSRTVFYHSSPTSLLHLLLPPSPILTPVLPPFANSLVTILQFSPLISIVIPPSMGSSIT